MTNSKKIPRV